MGHDIPLVSQNVDFRLTLALNPVISLSHQALLILDAQAHRRDNAAQEQEQDKISEHDTVSWPVIGRILLPEDIAADDAVDVTPAIKSLSGHD